MDRIDKIREQVFAGTATIEEFAAASKVSKRTVYEMMDQGLPNLKIRGLRLIVLEPAREWMLSRQTDRNPRKPGRPHVRLPESATV
jgi:hypothetical protein